MITFPETLPLNLKEKEKLIRKIVLDSLRSAVNLKIRPEFYIKDPLSELKSPLFIRIFKKGTLRGEMGKIYKLNSIVKDISESVAGAALQDIRFPPIKKEEIKELRIIIHFFLSCKNCENYGVYIRYDKYSSILFPWEKKSNQLESNLDLACKKAGILSPCWRNIETEIEKFHTVYLTITGE